MGSALVKDGWQSNSPKPHPGQIRVMVIDDSITARSALGRTIDAHRDMCVVATAGSAEVGLELLDEKQVDVVLLDLEMPGMGGLKALPKILEKSAGAKVLVVSTLTTNGAEATVAALAIGAADTLAKPRTGAFSDLYREELLAKIRGLAAAPMDREARPVVAQAPRSALLPGSSLSVIALGASTGGIHALGRFFQHLSPDIRAPILLTQHLPIAFMPVFARQVAAMSGRPARVAQEGDGLVAGEILIAPGDGHLQIRLRRDTPVVTIGDFPVASGCCPSVDPMLEAVAEVFGSNALGVVLSGMGRDGTEGAGLLHEAGGSLFAQDEASSAVFGMPRGIVEAGLAAAVDTPEGLAALIGKQSGKA